MAASESENKSDNRCYSVTTTAKFVQNFTSYKFEWIVQNFSALPLGKQSISNKFFPVKDCLGWWARLEKNSSHVNFSIHEYYLSDYHLEFNTKVLNADGKVIAVPQSITIESSYEEYIKENQKIRVKRTVHTFLFSRYFLHYREPKSPEDKIIIVCDINIIKEEVTTDMKPNILN